MADERLFRLKVVTPDGIFYEGEAIMLELHTTEGKIGVYRNHVPMMYRIEPGVMTITEEGGKKEAVLQSGLLQILQEKITVLTEAVEWL